MRLVVTLLATALLAPHANAKPKLAVMPLAALRADEATVRILGEILTVEVANRGEYQVISASEINAMLGMEKMKTALGCEDLSCAAEIGGALGVNLMTTGSVGRLGSKLMISLVLFDTQQVTVINRVRESIPADEDRYEQGIVDAVRKLLGDATAARADTADAALSPLVATPAEGEALPAAPEPVPEPIIIDGASPFYTTWWFWTLVGVATIAATVVVFGSMGSAVDSSYTTNGFQHQTPPGLPLLRF